MKKDLFRKELLDYIVNNKVSEKFLNSVKGIVISIISKNKTYQTGIKACYGSIEDAINDILNDILIKIKNKAHIFKNLSDNHGAYLYTMIKNHIVDVLRNYRFNISLDNESDDFENRIEYFLHSDDLNDSFESVIVSQYFFKELKKINDKYLCFYLYKVLYSEEICFSEKTKDAKYKINQRTKEKLKELVQENGVTEKEFLLAIRIYMSEICEKLRNNK
ncbi:MULTISPECIES: sigma-70 family RNA polymerase sigma factor [unclassified Thermosipho (in: thermotogales)]|uniref:sigma-70 family RNA polymerase sigma factor n=1 Tax=unclassified Thermosipho (in: thermotogales) TaxID=2676525 RepID=UPI000986F2E6|nr:MULTISPECIES: sigma-70 family RNA polymerase sigma factor [unclassified Thermosipho (in: thermotogales)]MBT1248368.1 hypothetical protein [Thermosipho sp. 1244]OOC47497.1 hypothetical protein XO09_00655 [Thermosipho sp. 1223]